MNQTSIARLYARYQRKINKYHSMATILGHDTVSWFLKKSLFWQRPNPFSGMMEPFPMVFSRRNLARDWTEERQLYRENFVEIQDGKYIFSVRKMTSQEQQEEAFGEYFSGMIQSEETISGERGILLASLQMLDTFKGAFPAIWLYATNPSQKGIAEIDVMEYVSQYPHHVHSNMHWGDSYNHSHHQNSKKIKADVKRMNEYGLVWDPKTIGWILNGRIIRVAANIYNDRDFVLKINLALGGWAEDPGGIPVQGKKMLFIPKVYRL